MRKRRRLWQAQFLGCMPILAIGILAAGAIGVGYYFKVVKPKKEETQEDGEDLEFYDGGSYINEDQAEDEEPADKEDEEE